MMAGAERNCPFVAGLDAGPAAGARAHMMRVNHGAAGWPQDRAGQGPDPCKVLKEGGVPWHPTRAWITDPIDLGLDALLPSPAGLGTGSHAGGTLALEGVLALGAEPADRCRSAAPASLAAGACAPSFQVDRSVADRPWAEAREGRPDSGRPPALERPKRYPQVRRSIRFGHVRLRQRRLHGNGSRKGEKRFHGGRWHPLACCVATLLSRRLGRWPPT
jgi:hypothetical protein